MGSDIEVHDLASIMSEHEEHIEDSKCHRGHGEEIDRSEIPDVIVQERAPGLPTNMSRRCSVLAWICKDERYSRTNRRPIQGRDAGSPTQKANAGTIRVR